MHISKSLHNQSGASFVSLQSSNTKSHENLLNSYSSSNSGSLDKQGHKLSYDTYRYDPASIIPLTISVVGLTGSTFEQEQENDLWKHSRTSSIPNVSNQNDAMGGSGKSCLCSRYMRPAPDDYKETDHTSVLTGHDFGGRVINNDHFLFWGQVFIPLFPNQSHLQNVITNSENSPNHSLESHSDQEPISLATNQNYTTKNVSNNQSAAAVLMRIVEQTEFIDDTTWRPFRSGKKSHDETYVKRCCALKLSSEEKLAYICKDQLGLEHEYEQLQFPAGKVEVDGYVICYDPSLTLRSDHSPLLTTQTGLVRAVLSAAKKARKPAVIALTKMDLFFPPPLASGLQRPDEAPDSRKFLDGLIKEIKETCLTECSCASAVPIVEVSARLDVNVSTVFSTLGGLILKARGIAPPSVGGSEAVLTPRVKSYHHHHPRSALPSRLWNPSEVPGGKGAGLAPSATSKPPHAGGTPLSPYSSAYKAFLKTYLPARVATFEAARASDLARRDHVIRGFRAHLSHTLTDSRVFSGPQGWRTFLTLAVPSSSSDSGGTELDPLETALTTLSTGECQALFRAHITEMKREALHEAVLFYLAILDRHILKRAFPIIEALNYDRSWDNFKELLRSKSEYSDSFTGPEDDENFIIDVWERDRVIMNATDASAPHLAIKESILIPWAVLNYPEAKLCFTNHIQHLVAEDTRNRLKREFGLLIAQLPHIGPGKSFEDAIIYFRGQPCFDRLSILDRREVFEAHQARALAQARAQFSELLLEYSETFQRFLASPPFSTVATFSQADFRDIHEALKHESRYKALERMDQERTVLLLQHLGFLQCPFKEHCPYLPACIDAMTPKILTRNLDGIEDVARILLPKETCHNSETPVLDLLIIGVGDLIKAFRTHVKSLYPHDIYIADGGTKYHLKLHTIESIYNKRSSYMAERNKVALRSPFDGIIGLFSSKNESPATNNRSVEEKSFAHLLADMHEANNIWSSFGKLRSCQAPSLILANVCANQSDPQDYIVNAVEKYQGRFITLLTSLADDAPLKDDCYPIEQGIARLLSEVVTDLSLKRGFLKNFISQAPFLYIANGSTSNNNSKNHLEFESRSSFPGGDSRFQIGQSNLTASLTASSLFSTSESLPEISVLVCMQCGDEYNIENVLGPLLKHRLTFLCQSLRSNKLRETAFLIPSFLLQQFTGWSIGEESFIARVYVSSYHTATAIHSTDHQGSGEKGDSENEPNHDPTPYNGYILTYSVKRKASFAVLKTFLENVVPKEKPSLVLGVTEHCFKSPSASVPGDENEVVTAIENAQQALSEIQSWIDQRTRNILHMTTATQIPFHANTPAFTEILRLTYECKKRELIETLNDEINNNYGLDSSYEDEYTFPVVKEEDNFDKDLESHLSLQLNSLQNNRHHAKNTTEFTIGDYMMNEQHLVKPSHIKKNRMSHLFLTDPIPKSYQKPCADTKQNELNSHCPGKLDMNRFANFNEEKSGRQFRGHPSEESSRPSHTIPHDLNMLCSTLKSGLVLGAPLTSPENTSDLCTPCDDSTKNAPQSALCNPTGAYYRPSLLKPRRHIVPPSNLPDIVNTANSSTNCEYPHLLSPSSILGDKSFASKIERLEQAKLNSHQAYRVKVPPANESTDQVPVPHVARPKKKGRPKKPKERTQASINLPMNLVLQSEQNIGGPNQVDQNGVRAAKDVKSRWKASILKVKSENQHVEPKEDHGIPLALLKCLDYIEDEGLDCEGIYRVPGSRCHVDQLLKKLQEDPQKPISEHNIPLNAVATTVKTFFSDSSVPIIPPNIYNDMLKIGAMSEKELKIAKWKSILANHRNDAHFNYDLLNYFIRHLSKISRSSKQNCMDSRNLAICWWPTLIRPDFTDFETMAASSKPLEEALYVLIENYDFIFESTQPIPVAN